MSSSAISLYFLFFHKMSGMIQPRKGSVPIIGIFHLPPYRRVWVDQRFESTDAWKAHLHKSCSWRGYSNPTFIYWLNKASSVSTVNTQITTLTLVRWLRISRKSIPKWDFWVFLDNSWKDLGFQIFCGKCKKDEYKHILNHLGGEWKVEGKPNVGVFGSNEFWVFQVWFRIPALPLGDAEACHLQSPSSGLLIYTLSMMNS